MIRSILLTLSAATALSAATYYVDNSNSGSADGNLGTSPSTAWRTLSKLNTTTFTAGDHVRLKAGCTWSEKLWPLGSGTDVSPIVVDSFGRGALPLVAAPGADTTWATGHAVRISNQEGWEFRNLEITYAGGRVGVLIHKNVTGIKRHIRLHNLVVHNVMGPRAVRGAFPTMSRYFGGVVIFDSMSTTPGKWEDVMIDSCTVYDCKGMGIQFSTPWVIDNQNDPAYQVRKAVLRGNTVHDVAQDGVVLRSVRGALMEYCLTYHIGTDRTGWLGGTWVKASDSCVMQYCETYNVEDDRNAMDGIAFDWDKATNDNVLQYCYSHNNVGGFYLTMGNPSPEESNRNVVRYCLSIDDSNRVVKIGDDKGSGSTTGLFYNNTVIQNAGVNCPNICVFDGGGTKRWVMKNNIFYINHSMGWNTSQITYSNNCYAGSNSTSAPSTDAAKVIANPLFVNAAAQGNGMGIMDSFVLRSNSPCLNAGTTLLDGMATNMPPDKWGNAFDATPNIGVYQGLGGITEVAGGHRGVKMPVRRGFGPMTFDVHGRRMHTPATRGVVVVMDCTGAIRTERRVLGLASSVCR